MTFEASRKKQFLVLQPKGKALYEDESSIGSKLMAKMGWNKGDGLGKEQHGSVDFIQVRYKNNANGLGFNGLKDDQWTENESSFDDLLKKLNSANSNPESKSGSGDEQLTTETKSLEEKSKLSRARVHYKKFTRGKDVHKYSEKDLANILGKKTLKEVGRKEKPEEVEEVDDDEPGVYDSNLIVNKGISVADYFKQKMQAKLQKPSEEIIENQPNESMEDQPEESIEDQQGETENVVKEKKKKKRKLEEDEVIEVLESAEDVEEKPVKKSKKKKQKESSDNDCEIVETIEKVEEEPPKKKKKSKKNPEEVSDVVEETTVAEKSKKKKKNKKEPEEEKVLAKTPEETTKSSKKKKNSTTKPSGEPERGANAVYSTNIIQIPSYVAQKLSSMSIHDFKNANLANVVGYGLTDNIEIKTVQTKIGQNTAGTDKYSLYNTDRLTTRQRQNPRKIFSKLKRTKKSIQVI